MKFPMAQTWTAALYIAGAIATIEWMLGTLAAGVEGNLAQVVINLLLSSMQVFLGTIIYVVPAWVLVAVVVLVGKGAMKVAQAFE